MTNLLESAKDIITSMIKDKEASEGLLDLKKELAEEYVKKMGKEKSDLFLAIGRDLAVDYLIDEGIGDALHDAVVGKAMTSFSSLAGDFENFREKLNNASTEQEIADLKNEILTASKEEISTSESDKQSLPPEVKQQGRENTDNVAIPSKSESREFPVSEKEENLGKVEGFDANKIQSSPFRKNPRTGSTLCAATAKFNAQKFGITLPSGNAWDASTAKPIEHEYKTSLPASKETQRPRKDWDPLSITDFDAVKDVNFADIYPDSKSKYGHRAIAFRDTTGEWMVLDPYVNVPGTSSTDPKKLEDYIKVRPVLKSHFYAVV